jgi:two-component system chemotaxis response regulator CheB
MAGSTIRILVAEKSVAVRSVLSEVVNATPRALLVGFAPALEGVGDAIERLNADLVLLSDAVGRVGIGAIRRRHPNVGIVLIASGDRASARLTMSTIGEGVLGFIERPGVTAPGAGHAELVRQLLPLVTVFLTRRITLHNADVLAERARPLPTGPDRLLRRRGVVAPVSIGLVAVGVSTGGPQALRELMTHLPGDLGAPVLVVQHMPTMFTQMMSQTLDRISQLTVREAQQGDRPVSGTALVAPGGRHMVLRRAAAGYQVDINDDPPVHACRPSVDVLYASIAACFTGTVLAVVMTGMGEDGLAGVRALKARQCYCLTQSEASCVVYGMPQAVDDADLSDERVPLNMLAGRIAALVRGGGQG